MTRFFNDTVNILSNVNVREFPYPHGVTLECLPPELYRMLAQARPDWEFIAEGYKSQNNKRVDLPAVHALNSYHVPDIWKDFIDYHVSHSFYLRVLDRFEPYFKEFYPELNLREFTTAPRYSQQKADIYLDCQIGVNTPVREEGTVSYPHLDSNQELWAALMYMRADDDYAGGDLIIHKCKEIPQMYGKRQIRKESLIPYERIPYKANTLACFVNTPYSIHSVTNRKVTEKPRLLVNLSLEFMDKKLFELERYAK